MGKALWGAGAHPLRISSGAWAPDRWAVWYVCHDREVVLVETPWGRRPPVGRPPVDPGAMVGGPRLLGWLGDTPCAVAAIAGPAPGGVQGGLSPLRAHLGEWPAGWVRMAARAVQIADWLRNHRFCGRCAAPLVLAEEENAARCPRCELTVYPRQAPAVIVRVCRGEQILLARSPHFPPGLYSVLAGFVEPGESLEEAVHREVAEEVGISVDIARYVGSQTWPFPHSLMIAFEADYAGGVLRPAPGEIEDAQWFDVDSLPRTPPPGSISHQLIASFVASRQRDRPASR